MGGGLPDPWAVLATALSESRPELRALLPGAGEPWPARRWLLADWAAVLGSDTGPRHVLFHGGPGFGKTVAAAQYGLEAAASGWKVAGLFFRHGYAPLEDPHGVMEHLSAQLALLLPGFREAREGARMESGAGNPIQVSVAGDINVTATHVPGKVVGLQVARPVRATRRACLAL